MEQVLDAASAASERILSQVQVTVVRARFLVDFALTSNITSSVFKQRCCVLCTAWLPCLSY